MAIPKLTSMPPAPARTDPPAVFVPKADATVAAQVNLADELNASIDQMNIDIPLAIQAAEDAEDSAATAQANANFVGEWADQVGAANVPYAVEHNGSTWQLLNNIADVTLDEPSKTAPNWKQIFNLSRADAHAIALSF